ncbi:MAG: hypothetical protein IKD72_05015, partial [Clostridia bacterium]|nr:hypothetical protein [Clostridia bacterium]
GDIRTFSEQTLTLVKNKALLRINQDKEARPCFAPERENDARVFVKLLSDNEIAVMLANFNDYDTHLNLFFENIGIPAASGYGLEMTDVFTGESLGVKKEFLRRRVPAHDCECYICKLTK